MGALTVREKAAWDESFPAGADLTGDQYKIVKLNASGQVVLSGAGELAIGVLQNKPGDGEAAQIRIFGLSRVISKGSNAEPGNALHSDANGFAVTTGGAGTIAIGTATGLHSIEEQVETILLNGPTRNHV